MAHLGYSDQYTRASVAHARNRRCGETAEYDDSEPVSDCGTHPGKHDAWLRLAIARHGSAHRADASRDATRSWADGRRGARRDRRPQPVARTRRQHDDVSLTVPGDSAAPGGIGSRARGRIESAF